MKTIENNGIITTYGNLTIDEVGPSLNKNKNQAQLRQVITKTYPAARGNDSLSDALVPSSAFGPGQEYDEIRIAWVGIPKDWTQKHVAAELKRNPDAMLYKTVSLLPILTEEQQRSIDSGLNTLTRDDYAKRVVVDQDGKPALYKGYKQYRKVSFSLKFREDVDLREEQIADMEPVQMAKAKASQTSPLEDEDDQREAPQFTTERARNRGNNRRG